MGSDGYQSALRHKQQEDVTPSRRPFLRVYQRERLAVIFSLIYLLNDVNRP